jgi:hypothetical protein
VADLERFRAETVTHIDVAAALALTHHSIAALLQPLKCYESYTTILVAEIGPNNIIKDVSFDSIDGARQSRERLRFGGRMESCRIDSETRYVIEMRVGDEIGRYVRLQKM